MTVQCNHCGTTTNCVHGYIVSVETQGHAALKGNKLNHCFGETVQFLCTPCRALCGTTESGGIAPLEPLTTFNGTLVTCGAIY